ncbi:MAG: DUF3703 domain-containing protein [Hydrogenophaga sp.]|uniref:DUF3703 domain-containing protein n=1 Tax=Hydrogenophaga sp. TaxID=1904254 RepID=UPI00260539BD|nr:DUF3703 domain-containing protein [Hydrogenophaga sp.]MDD3785542.1 DUF3703 domain-containing protein [Hydrogenophaga sp.]MDX9969332.1 DUF3703 domain-containing protein [Hydrogenophaga sp.]
MNTKTMPTEATAPVAFDPDTFERLHRAYLRVDRSDLAQAWHLLEALHVLGQTRLVPHARTHGLMLSLAWRTRNLAEVNGQLLRLLLVPLGHLLGRLPLGNTGRSHVGAFRPMQVAPELLATIRAHQRPPTL